MAARAHDRRGHQRHRAAPARRATGSAPSTSPPPPAPATPRWPCGARRTSSSIPTGDEVRPLGSDPAPGELRRHELADARARRRARSGCTVESLARAPGRPGARSRPRSRDAAARADLVIVIAGSSAGRDDYTADVVAQAGTLLVHGVAVKPGPSRRARPRGRHGRARRTGLSGLRRADVRHLRDPAAGRARGAAPVDRPRAQARLARRLASSLGSDDWIRVRLGRVGGGLVATPLPRGAGVLTSLVRADGLLVVPAALEGHDAGARRSRCGCCATSTRSSVRSSRSARTTRCSTSPPRCCARAIRCRRS